MSGIDYYNCDCCGNGKIWYDAGVDYESIGESKRLGMMRCICSECYDKGIRIQINFVEKTSKFNEYAHSSTKEGDFAILKDID